MNFLRELAVRFKLDILDCFKSDDFGPLDHIDSQIRPVKFKRSLEAFKNDFYLTVRSKSSGHLYLYKLKGPLVNRNLYCLIESDAVKRLYLDEKVIGGHFLKVPEDVKFFCGRASTKISGNFKDMVVAFVPDDYLRLLIESQGCQEANKNILEKVYYKQCKIFYG